MSSSETKLIAIIGARRKEIVRKWQSELARERDARTTITDVINKLIDQEHARQKEVEPKVFY